ncbi:DsbA family protein [Demequina sediminicola]|uniref:DsbA family protein n=1 Tax=Demequina sediminicola TaxID=1095026 RepID=UPI00128C36CC|nr:thioredoxin domain-containing protein [Demequina sediminicola]
MPTSRNPRRARRAASTIAIAGVVAGLTAGCSAESTSADPEASASAAPTISESPDPSASATTDGTAEAAELPSGPDSFGAVPIGTDGVAFGPVATGDVPVVDVYFDFACHYCMLFEMGVTPDLVEMAEAGEATVVLHPVAILDRNFPSAYSTRASAAAMVVAETSPEHFLLFTASLMSSQEQLPEDGWTENQLAELATDLGAPQETADAILSTDFEDTVGEATEAAFAGGMQGTPSVAVDGALLDYEQINYIEPGALTEYLDAL